MNAVNKLNQDSPEYDSRELSSLNQPFSGMCFAHVMSGLLSPLFSKSGKTSESFDGDLPDIDINHVKTVFQRCITWTKKSGKGASSWIEAQQRHGMPVQKLTTPVKTRMGSSLLMFKQMCEKRKAIEELYARIAPASMRNRNPSRESWVIAQAVTDILEPVYVCIVKQQRRSGQYWILSDAVADLVNVYMKYFKPSNVFDAGDDSVNMDANFLTQLQTLRERISSHIKKNMQAAISAMFTFEESSGHIMLAVMLDPRFKKMSLLSKLLKSKMEAKTLISHYANKILMPLVMDCHQKLFPARYSADSCDESGSSSGIFQEASSSSSSRPSQAQCHDELQAFRKFSVKNGTEEGPLIWWKEHESKFPVLARLARHILAIPASQIECERVFSIAGMLTRHRRNRTAADIFETIMFINKNIPQEKALAGYTKTDSLFDEKNEDSDDERVV